MAGDAENTVAKAKVANTRRMWVAFFADEEESLCMVDEEIVMGGAYEYERSPKLGARRREIKGEPRDSTYRYGHASA